MTTDEFIAIVKAERAHWAKYPISRKGATNHRHLLLVTILLYLLTGLVTYTLLGRI